MSAARQIVAQGMAPLETYRALVSLYARQPNLPVRSSTSIEQQAYSTPVPLAYLASLRAGITGKTTVYEPTAGNGALLIGADERRITANEMNPQRAAQLRGLYPAATVTQGDALKDNLVPNQFDAVIANPPFGAVRDADGETIIFEVGGGYETREIDLAIAMAALAKMKDGGRAVLIVGSVNKQITGEAARSDAYNAKAKREFYFKLYGAYAVTDHFTVAGELYSRQGAGWPVDVIVIEGRSKSALPLPAVKPPRQFDSWDALEGELDGRAQIYQPVDQPAGSADPKGGRPGGRHGGNRGGGRGGRPDLRDQRPADVEPGGVPDGSVGGQPGSTGLDGGQTGIRPGEDAKADDDNRNRPDRRSPAVKRETVAGENALQVTYQPASKSDAFDTLVPVNMQTAIGNALDALQDRVGDVDSFVADRLGYCLPGLGLLGCCCPPWPGSPRPSRPLLPPPPPPMPMLIGKLLSKPPRPPCERRHCASTGETWSCTRESPPGEMVKGPIGGTPGRGT